MIPRDSRGGDQRTFQDGTIGRQKAVLQSLLDIAGFKGLLLCDNLMDIISREQGYFVATMPVVYTEESQTFVGVGLLLLLIRELRLQVEDSGMGVFHTNPPALHGRNAIDAAFILTLGGSLKKVID